MEKILRKVNHTTRILNILILTYQDGLPVKSVSNKYARGFNMLVKCLECGYIGTDDQFIDKCPNCENDTKFIALTDI